MKNLNQIFSKFLRSLKYGDQLRPQRDWALLIAFGALLFIGSIAFNIWFFIASENGRIVSAKPTQSSKQLNATAVMNVQTIFKQRATEEGNYQNEYHFVDPTQPGS